MRKSTMISGKNTPISAIYGIGEKRAALFSKLGVNNAGDLVYYFPRGYENRGNIKTVEEVEDGEVCSLELTVSAKPKSVPASVPLHISTSLTWTELLFRVRRTDSMGR